MEAVFLSALMRGRDLDSEEAVAAPSSAQAVSSAAVGVAAQGILCSPKVDDVNLASPNILHTKITTIIPAVLVYEVTQDFYHQQKGSRYMDVSR